MLHGYSPSLGIWSVRERIDGFSSEAFWDSLSGGAYFLWRWARRGALAHAFRLVTEPGDEILTFAPFFPEYHPYVDLTGAQLKVVPADTEQFQINFAAFESMLSQRRWRC